MQTMRRLGCVCLMLCALALHAANVEVVNEGHGGWNSRMLRDFFRPDFVRPGDTFVLYCGMNDACNSKALIPLENYRENVQFLIDAAKKQQAGTIVLLTFNPIIGEYVRARHKTHPEKDIPAHLAKFDAAVRELAAKNGVILADIRAAMEKSGGASKDKSSLLRNEANSNTADGVHPTSEGYRVIAQTVFAAIKDHHKPGARVFCYGDSITFGAAVKGAGSSDGETYPAQLKALLNTGK